MECLTDIHLGPTVFIASMSAIHRNQSVKIPAILTLDPEDHKYRYTAWRHLLPADSARNFGVQRLAGLLTIELLSILAIANAMKKAYTTNALI